MAKAGKTLRRRLRELTGGDAVSYVSSFKVSRTFTLPQTVDLKDYEGLSYCQTVTSGAGARFTSYGEDKQHFDAHGARFIADASLPPPNEEGLLADFKAAHEGFSGSSTRRISL
jgi:hypothetical protein